MRYNKIIYYINVLAFIFLVLSGCSEIRKSALDGINVSALSATCMAFDCHNGTQLRIYPPISGAHLTHLDPDQIGVSMNCGSCHSSYTNIQGGLHKNGFVNGYNWLYGAKTAGEIVSFGPDMNALSSSMAFDHAAGNCSSTGSSCHNSSTPNWYSGSVCGSCHTGPPLNKFPPASGAHMVHQYKNYRCLTCHYRYTAQATHNNGIVDGYIWQTRTSVAGNIVIFSAIAGTSPSFSHASGDCTTLGCHGARNWYSYPYSSNSQCGVCHQYPPLNQATPNSGRHGTHLGRGYSCQTCHNNYAVSNALHNNGAINGSGFDPKVTVPATGNSVIFSGGGSFNTSTANCSGTGSSCHNTDTLNWYTGGD